MELGFQIEVTSKICGYSVRRGLEVEDTIGHCLEGGVSQKSHWSFLKRWYKDAHCPLSGVGLFGLLQFPETLKTQSLRTQQSCIIANPVDYKVHVCQFLTDSNVYWKSFDPMT